MNVIHLLPDSVANQIAAGEVIQRPASVIKELMENSIDAGATDIRVSVTDAGRTMIQVVDDGSGMNETDARLAFERHATSKISSAQDLYNLNTMGFRGEALASIAAVAQVELLTRQEGEELGIKLEIAGSEVVSQEPCATPKGSRFCVRNLFFNVPARRRFLKSDTAEMRHVCSEFLRVALAHPGVSVSLTSNGTTLYNLPAGNVKQRVAGVAGIGMAKLLLPVQTETSIVKISGFIGTPDTARKTGGDQYFFANDRYMRSSYFNKAVTDAYKGIIPADHVPAYFIYLAVDPQALDVNVHPQKTEIKFDDDQAIWRILNAAVASCLNDNNILPQIDFDSGERIDIPRFDPTASQTTDNYNPFTNESQQGAIYAGHIANHTSQGDIHDWETIYQSAAGGGSNGSSAGFPTSSFSGGSYSGSSYSGNTFAGGSVSGGTFISREFGASEAQQTPQTSGITWHTQPTEAARLFDPGEAGATAERPHLSQYKRRYIMCAMPSGLMIIDQHRASERILFDSLMAKMQASAVESQSLLFPDVIPMGAEDLCIVSEISEELKQVGLETTIDNEEGALTITSVPAALGIAAIHELIEDLMVGCRTGEVDIHTDIKSAIVGKMASHGATPYGRELTQADMNDIYDKLMASVEKQYTPSGKAIVRVIADEDLNALFG